jgi:predicted nuclease of predicted toxin-antitoxin system
VTIWVDAQLSPAVAEFIEKELGLPAVSARRLGLLEAKDAEIFEAARDADAIVLTKDGDFAALLERNGPPPRVIWITCGNTSNANLRELLRRLLRDAVQILESGEPLVEIGESRS